MISRNVTTHFRCLGNLLIGKGATATSQGCETNMPGQGTIRADEGAIRVDQYF